MPQSPLLVYRMHFLLTRYDEAPRSCEKSESRGGFERCRLQTLFRRFGVRRAIVILVLASFVRDFLTLKSCSFCFAPVVIASHNPNVHVRAECIVSGALIRPECVSMAQ